MAIERYIRERFIMTHKDFQWDSKCSKEAFIKFIAPDLSKKYKIKSIRAAESSGDEMFELMDMQSGIDYFVIDCRNSGKVQTIANRVRWFDTWKEARQYNEITIRFSRPSGRETEWHKILRAVKTGETYPTYYCNAYLWVKKGSDDIEIARICTAKTKQLYELCEIDLARENPLMVTKEKYNGDGTSFFGVNMDMYDLAKKGLLYEKNEVQKNLEIWIKKNNVMKV